jgi:hypothetical protein
LGFAAVFLKSSSLLSKLVIIYLKEKSFDLESLPNPSTRLPSKDSKDSKSSRLGSHHMIERGASGSTGFFGIAPR